MRCRAFVVALFFLQPVMAAFAQDDVIDRRIELVISERKVQLEPNSVRVTQGENIELVWNSDERAKLHLHGYDIEFEVSPEQPVSVRFHAHATGRFPITSHGFEGENGHGHAALMYVEVYPQ